MQNSSICLGLLALEELESLEAFGCNRKSNHSDCITKPGPSNGESFSTSTNVVPRRGTAIVVSLAIVSIVHLISQSTGRLRL